MNRKNINRGYKKLRVWQGVVTPGTCKNIHGEIVKIDPKTLDPNTEVMRF
jgi:hypothetical protein